MVRRLAARTACTLLATCVLVASCKSVPTSTVTLVPEPAISRDTKIGWTIRLEQERRLRDTGVVPATSTPAAPPFRAATAPALDVLALDPDQVVRRRAVLAMGRVGTVEVVPRLLLSLSDPDDDVREAAAFALGLVGQDARSAVKSLLGALADPSLTVRARAVDALGLIGDASAVPGIYQTASGCGARLASLGPDDEQPKSPEIEVCRAALFAFVRLKSYDGIAGVALTSQNQPASRWWPVAYALQRIGDRRAAPALVALASGPGVYTVGFALRGLAALKDAAAVPVARTLASARDADLKVRVAAVRTLGAVGGREGAVPLIDLLGASPLPPELLRETLAALGGSRYSPAFDVVVDYMTDGEASVRAAALTAAADVAPDAFLVVLAGLAADKDWSVRAALARALSKLPADRVGTAVRELAADEDARVRAPALEALAAIKPQDLGARLFKALEAADYVERATAARLVGELKLPGSVQKLVIAYERAQSDSAYDARAAALAALAAFDNDEVRTIIRRGLGDREWPVRLQTATLLHGLGDATATPERPARLHMPQDWFTSEALLHPPFSPRVFIETRHGTVEAELDVVDAAATSHNFVELARAGFFDGMKIHRVVPAFVVQAGDPRGDGNGGPGYTIPDELTWKPFVRGTLGMALAGPDTGGSQFFITLSPQPHLDGKYTVFGNVVNGWDVLDQISLWDVIERVRVWDGVEFR